MMCTCWPPAASRNRTVLLATIEPWANERVWTYWHEVAGRLLTLTVEMAPDDPVKARKTISGLIIMATDLWLDDAPSVYLALADRGDMAGHSHPRPWSDLWKDREVTDGVGPVQVCAAAIAAAAELTRVADHTNVTPPLHRCPPFNRTG
jgi:hypothetical protein